MAGGASERDLGPDDLTSGPLKPALLNKLLWCHVEIANYEEGDLVSMWAVNILCFL